MKQIIMAVACASMLAACGNKAQESTENPFFTEFNTPYGTPDFENIKFEHYEPALLKGIEQQNADIEAIVNNAEAPTFENTIVALDNSGEILGRVSAIFNALTSAETTDELTALEEKFGPILSEHNDKIYQNEQLFARVKAVYEQEVKGDITLTTEQHYLLDKYYKAFVRSGAGLPADQQARLREINKELASLSIAFSKHILNEVNSYKLYIDKKEDLAGLPEALIATAAADAKADGQEGKWLFTLQGSSVIPFLQYAENRELRKQIYQAYINKGNHGDDNDNKALLKRTLELRTEKAKIMGFPNHASFVLDKTMAKTPKAALDFLYELWPYAIEKAKEERAQLQAIMDKEGKGEKLEAWDWRFYAEKLRKEKYDLSEDVIKPYFAYDNVVAGMFETAHKLYGINFKKSDSISVYNSDVQTYIVTDADGSHLGVFYMDYIPRKGKRGGAWMSNFREQRAGQRPHIYNVGSFTKPVGDTPALLTLDEAETLFHEFGHGLHGMLAKGNYQGISGTAVPRDFVELPSQLMEHWVTEPEVMKTYAKHYQTGEVISDELIAKVRQQKFFNQGFMFTELLAAALLDMELHSQTSVDGMDVMAFEKNLMDKLGLIPEIAPRYRSTYFNHIMGGYDAGYYSYLWSERLDADAFDAFAEKGIFNQEVAKSFRTNVLEKGGADDPMKLYIQFRGAEPKVDAMLRYRGLKK